MYLEGYRSKAFWEYIWVKHCEAISFSGHKPQQHPATPSGESRTLRIEKWSALWTPPPAALPASPESCTQLWEASRVNTARRRSTHGST